MKEELEEFYLRYFFNNYTKPFAIFLMTPFQVIKFLKIVMSVIFFSSNILFWRQDGYFNDSSDTNLLIHTWVFL